MRSQSDQHRRLQHLATKRSRKARLVPMFVSILLASFVASMSPISAYGGGKSGVKVLADQALPSGYIADIYFPRSARLQRGRREDSLPLVVFLPGAFVDKSQYASVASLIAEEGFVVAVPNPLVLFVEVNTVNDVLSDIEVADQDPRSPLYKVVDTDTLFVSGHSLGGAVGLFALTGTCAPQICSTFPSYEQPKALMGGGFYGTNLVEDGILIELEPPAQNVLLLQGSNDSIAPPDEATQTYPSLATSRALVEIKGADHYGVCVDGVLPPPVAEDPTTDDPDPPLAQAESNQRVARWLVSWFKSLLMD